MAKLLRPIKPRRPLMAVTLLTISVLLGACGEHISSTRRVGQAKEQIAKGELAAAAFTLKSALQEEPDLAEARFLLGGILLNAGDAAGAESELRRALDLGFVKDEVIPQLAGSLLAAGKYTKVVSDYAAVELATPAAWAGLKTTVATAWALQGNPVKAEFLVEQVLAKAPNFAPALLVKARLRAGLADAQGASAIADQVLAREPDNIQAWRLRGDLKLLKGADVRGAIVAYQKVVELAPTGAEGHVALITANLLEHDVETASKNLDRLRKLYPGSSQVRLFDAHMAFVRGDFAKARDLAQQLLKFSPDNAGLLNLAGASEMRLKSWHRAESILAKAVHVAPDLLPSRKMLAQVYMQTGRSAKALEILRPVIDSDRVSSDILIIAAEAHLLTGRAPQAEQLYIRAAKQKPDDALVKTALALIRMSKGDTSRALSELSAVSDSSVETVADMALVSAHMRRNDFDAAMRAVEKLDAKQPQSARGPLLRAQLLSTRKDMAAVRKNLELAVQREPTNFAGVAGLSGLDLAESKPQAARDRMEAFVAREPKNEQAWVTLAGVVSRAGGSVADVGKTLERAVAAVPSAYDPRVALAEHQLARHEVRAALASAQLAASSFPEGPEALDVLGRAQQAVGDSNQALKTFGSLAVLQPKSSVAHLRLADVHRAAGNLEAALVSTRRALEIEPESPRIMAAMVALSVQSKQPEKALQLARGVKTRHPTDAAGHVFEGDIQIWQKNPDLALAAYRSGTAAKTGGDVAAVRLHATLLQLGRGSEAGKFAEQWLQKFPRDLRFKMHLGDVALAAKSFPEAERLYLQVLVLAPQHSSALNNAAWAMVNQKKTGAVSLAEKAVAIAPQKPEFVDTLAAALAQENQFDRAIELQLRLVNGLPANETFRLNLVRLYQRAGNGKAAIEQLEPLNKQGTAAAKHAEVAQLVRELSK